MTDSTADVGVDGGAPPVPASAGALLRAAREGAGMTIDAVAQQLKLAPRQVRAIEEGDFSHLPGRTFVRGFIRNYARLVRLDVDLTHPGHTWAEAADNGYLRNFDPGGDTLYGIDVAVRPAWDEAIPTPPRRR